MGRDIWDFYSGAAAFLAEAVLAILMTWPAVILIVVLILWFLSSRITDRVRSRKGASSQTI